MSAGKTIAYILAGLVIVFGFLFILGAFSPDGSTGWLLTGSILVIFGFGIIWFASRMGAKGTQQNVQQNVTMNIDLPGDMEIEQFKCQNCGSPLTMDNVKMVAGAPMVNCPYCNAAYQLKEQPKW